FNIKETPEGLRCLIEYSTALYEAPTIERMGTHFTELLKAVINAPAQTIGMLPMLTLLEKEQLLVDFNDTMVGYPKETTIIDIIEEQVKKYPDNIAVTFGNQHISYRQLNERSNQLAHYLRSRGVVADMPVPICLDAGIDMIIGIVGILKAGGGYVPVDPTYPAERIGFMIEDSGAPIVIGSRSTCELISRAIQIETILLDEQLQEGGILKKQPKENPGVKITPRQLAYVIYTSGSTGKPKGVQIEHRNVVRLFKTDKPLYDFNEKDVWSVFHSFCFDFSVWEMYGALFYGGRMVVVPKEVTHDINRFADLLQTEKVTVLNQTPSAFYVLQEILVEKAKEVSIRYVIFGGEALNPAKLQPWKQSYPGSKLVNMYGITETTVHVTYQEIEWLHIQGGGSIIGKPIPTLRAYIVDVNHNLVPVGVAGELMISGAGLARGYLHRAELTAERFIKNPFANAGEEGDWSTLYCTGDLGRWHSDGNIEYLGRIDEQVKIRGYRIELGEIETVIQQSGLVSQAVVLARANKEGTRRLSCYVVAGDGYTREGLMNRLKERLPDYMVPQLWMEMESLPLTSNGKIDKKVLPDIEAGEQLSNKYVAPRNEIEHTLIEIWQQLLQVKEIGVYDNFFNLGGHSLLAMRVMFLINKSFKLDISINNIFIYPTVADLGEEVLRQLNHEKDDTLSDRKYLVPIKTGSPDKTSLYIVCGGGGTALRFKKFAAMMDEDQPVYALQSPVGVDDLGTFPDTIEDIAGAFIKEILILNPNGPYALSGHCVGGVIAFEMAKQLEAQGKTVHFLAMFDTIIRIREKRAPGSIKNLYYVPFYIQAFISKARLKFDFETFLFRKHARKAIGYKMKMFRNIIKKMKKDVDSHQLENTGLEIFNESTEIYKTASRNYKLAPYDGKILLFYAKERYFFTDTDNNIRFKKVFLNDSKKNIWRQYANSISIFDVEGDHSDMFEENHGDKFARLLQQYLYQDTNERELEHNSINKEIPTERNIVETSLN
ncbi:MAG: amino acid adenylation domain-containing protein, partial [Ferruginibacter sp.]